MKTALILIDIQNDYFENGANELTGSIDAANNARFILDEFRSKGLPVIHIQHLSNRPSATFFIPGTNGAEIHDLVRPLNGEKVVIKNYPNSFRETILFEYLKSLDVDRLVICGMMTHMCVDATTRAAKDLGFDCIVLGDACATKDLEINGNIVKAEYVQAGFLAALNYFYSNVFTTRDFIEGYN